MWLINVLKFCEIRVGRSIRLLQEQLSRVVGMFSNIAAVFDVKQSNVNVS